MLQEFRSWFLILEQPRIDDDLMTFYQFFRIFPFVQTAQIIFSHDQRKRNIGIFFFQVRECINSVAGRGKRKLYVGGAHLRVILDRKLNHIQSVVITQQRLFFFKWILRAHHEPKFVHIRIFENIIGQNQVPDMDRIETAEKKSNFLHKTREIIISRRFLSAIKIVIKGGNMDTTMQLPFKVNIKQNILAYIEFRIPKSLLLKYFAALIALFCCVSLWSQQKEYWLTDVANGQRKVVKDSATAAKFLDSLSQNNFYLTELKSVNESENSIEIFYDKGKNFNGGLIKLEDEVALNLKLPRELYSQNIDSLKKAVSENYRLRGFAFNRVKTKFLGLKNGEPQLELSVAEGERRKLDAIVVRGYEKVPKRFIKNIERDFKGQVYDDKNLSKLNQTLQNHPFVALEKPPQTLFTRDSTQIYLFLQKKKSNTFDGIVGFGNDKNEKFSFNGSLNVNFRNMFNSFETVNIFWQRNPDRGQTFDLKTDIPYVAGSNIGMTLNVNVFRQDSTFATFKFLPGIYLNLGIRQKIGLRGTFETSAVTDSLFVGGRDFNKKGVGVWYDYMEPTEIALFQYKTRLRAEADLISTRYAIDPQSIQQNNFFFSAERNLAIKGNHYLNLRAETALMNSKGEPAVNELLRFGGWDSLRGFNEDTLLADFYYFGTAEYRYLVGEQAFFDIFGQYGGLNNSSLAEKPKLYSFGLGFNFFLPIGLMSFQISNGNQFGNSIRFGDTKIHWGVISKF